MSLRDALGGMSRINQWFIWRLVWDAVEGKYQKTPCAMDGSHWRIDASLAQNWHSYDEVAARAVELRANAPTGVSYTVGFWMTADCGYWFFDLDGVAKDGVLNDHASAMVAAFPDAMMEWSSSRRGIHIFGSSEFDLPPHSTRPPRASGLHYEFYSQGRGVAFGLDGIAQGCADVYFDEQVAALIGTYFPPRAASESVVRADWRGPADDDELIRRALNAKQSAEVVFGGKPGFGQLWRGECEHDSSADMALASHLAFWTGCDEERMEGLMRKSGLKRAKWDEHRTYLRELTIANACAGCSAVYQEPERSVVAQSEVYGMLPVAGNVTTIISPEMSAKVVDLLSEISACGTVDDMHNIVIPMVRATGVPAVYHDRLASAVMKQLDIWQSKLPIGKLRAVMFPPALAGTGGTKDVPLWAQRHCYVKDGDYFFDTANATTLTFQGFQAEFSRNMPMKDNGMRENPVEWALQRWDMRTVHRVAYRPDEPEYFTWDGMDHVNKYSASSVPAVAPYTTEGVAGISAFQALLWDMCARREDVYLQVLCWMAHNVQRPGHKIRWSPVFKGVQGDGKSIIGVFLRSAMGWRNVGITGNSTLTNNGGFNDWAVGHAVNIIEEIMLTGKERHRLYNAMKEFISNDVANINAKGDKTYMVKNITNHLATTNHVDGIPLERTDRRWLVIFTPWDSLTGMARYSGLTTEALNDRFKAVDVAMRTCGGELRAWLLSVPMCAEFNANGNAISTPEKSRMMASSRDDIESVASQIINDGAHGVTSTVLSSACLTNILRVRALLEGFDVPRGSAVNHLLTRLGFEQIERPIKWEQKAHRIWIKGGISDDSHAIRLQLDASR